MGKIRALLGRRGPQPREASDTSGAPASGDGVAGEPTRGSALGMHVDELASEGAAGSEPDAGPAEDPGSR
jgi:hypothetical protein